MSKKLYKSATDKKISGVCGGLGEYLGVDPTFVRLLWLLFAFFTAGAGALIAYIACAIIIPEDPLDGDITPSSGENYN